MRLSPASALISALLLPLLPMPRAQSEDQVIDSTFKTRDCDFDAYRAHILQLQNVVAACSNAMNPQQCAPSLAGPDDNVAFEGRQRLVQYNWLRDALDQSGKSGSDVTKKTSARAAMNAAAARLSDELARPLTGDPIRPVLARAKPVLGSVLASSEFSNLSQPSLLDRALQRIFAWLDRRLNRISGHPLSPRTIQLCVYGSLLMCVTLLGWWYGRQVRQQRLLFVSRNTALEKTASAIDWQSRLDQAKTFAAAGEWREAVHHVYWAAISRLEALGNWPADRTRTPREYLRLLPPSGEKRRDLLLLTKSFERIWYGRKGARQEDFDDAHALLERLVSR